MPNSRPGSLLLGWGNATPSQLRAGTRELLRPEMVRHLKSSARRVAAVQDAGAAEERTVG